MHNYSDKSNHAKQRQGDGRNVGTAGHDLNNAKSSDVYIKMMMDAMYLEEIMDEFIYLNQMENL